MITIKSKITIKNQKGHVHLAQGDEVRLNTLSLSAMFHLHCDPLHSAFTLCQEGETWRLTFDSFEEAYDQAETCTADEAHLVLHNASGSVVCQTTISPLEPALLQARVHWKDVANAEITDGGQLTVVARG